MGKVIDYLQAREWSMGNGQCPDCCGLSLDWLRHFTYLPDRRAGHKLDCKLAGALREAGVEPMLEGDVERDLLDGDGCECDRLTGDESADRQTHVEEAIRRMMEQGRDHATLDAGYDIPRIFPDPATVKPGYVTSFGQEDTIGDRITFEMIRRMADILRAEGVPAPPGGYFLVTPDGFGPIPEELLSEFEITGVIGQQYLPVSAPVVPRSIFRGVRAEQYEKGKDWEKPTGRNWKHKRKSRKG